MRNNNVKKILALALLFTASSAFAAITKPGAPVRISAATVGQTSADVSFSPPASNGGAAITNYTVSCNPACTSVSGPASPLRIQNMTPGIPYTFTVTATNSAGTSVASTASNPAPTCYTPTDPTNTYYYVGWMAHFNVKNINGGSGSDGAYCIAANGCDGTVTAYLMTCSNFTGYATYVKQNYGPAYDNTIINSLYTLKAAGREAQFTLQNYYSDPVYKNITLIQYLY